MKKNSTKKEYEKIVKYLEEKKYNHIDISDGAFSFVTRIKFNHTDDDEIEDQYKEFEEAGFNDLISKPFKQEDLVKKLYSVLAKNEEKDTTAV